MKGPFSMWAFFGITLWIDLFTLLIYKFKKEKKELSNINNTMQEVSVIIPAHKEEENIKATLLAVFKESYRAKNIIVCGDEESKDMKKIVEKVQKEHSNIMYVESPYKSKAKKINYVIEKEKDNLGEYVYIRDARVAGEKDCIEKMVAHFKDKNIAAVTSYGCLHPPKNILSRAYHYGKSWTDDMGKFRKNAQQKRRAVFVICGASTMYRKDVLEKFPIPYISKTEDTHHTWQLQMNNYSIKIANDAMVSAHDVDGKKIEGIKKQLKQAYRWSSGTVQCMYCERRNMLKSKRLFYTTIAPGFIEALMYSISLILIPLFLFVLPSFAIGFLISDTLFSLGATLFIIPKKFFSVVARYPGIFFFKYLNSAVFISAVIVVSFQAIRNQKEKWSNEWKPL